MKRASAAVTNPLDRDAEGQVWSLCMIGLCIFMVSVVTARVAFADVGAVLGVLGLVSQRAKVRFPGPAWLFAIFLLWAALTAIVSDYPQVAFEALFERLKLFLIFVVALNALRSEQQIRVYLYIYLACFVLQPARTSLQGYALGDTVSGRAMGPGFYANPNDLAALTLLAMGYALALATSLRERKAIRILSWLSIGVFVIVILLTQSRGVVLGGLIAFGPALLVLLLARPSRLVYAGILVAVVLAFVPSSAWERLAGMSNLTSEETVAEADPEGSAAMRLEIQKAAWQMMLTRPVFGAGIGTFHYVLQRDTRLGYTDAHSTYLSLGAELGFPGLILWITMVWKVLAVARRGRVSAGEAGRAIEQVWIERATLGFLVAGFFGSYAALSYLYLYLGFLWCRGTLLLEASSSKPRKPGDPGAGVNTGP